MKYAIALISLVALVLIVWVMRAGTGTDTTIMVVAIVSVVFFGALPNLWNSMYSKHKRAPSKVPPENAVVVKLPPKGTAD